MADDDLRYYQRRAENELRQAREASLPEAAAIHAQLADAYLAHVAHGSRPPQSDAV